MTTKPLTIVDVETTGASSEFGRVIEIGLLRVEAGKVVRTFQTLINPEIAIPEFITRMTGITNSDVAEAPRFTDVAGDLAGLFSGSVFVAHNALFDYSFIRAEFERAGLQFSCPRLCTVQLSRAIYPEERHHNLSALIKRHDLSCENRHRAFDDAHVLWQFLLLLKKTFSEDQFQIYIQKLIRHPK